jgi:monoamine oxidase
MIGGNDDDDESRADRSGEIRLPATLEATGPVPGQTEIAIVGGGVMGLAIAYYLAQRGLDDVVVLERGYLAEGASGRNGGGIRQQWSTEINIRLMQDSVELCRRFAVDVGVNVWFRQGGYLFLARSAKEVARLEKNIAIQNKCGVATRMLQPSEAQDIVPELDLTGVVQPDGRHPVPVAVSLGLRASGSGARRSHLHADGGHRTRACQQRWLHTHHVARHRPRAPGDQRMRCLVAEARRDDRRERPDLPDPPRNLLERAAQAVLAPHGVGAVERPLLQSVDAR